MDKPRPLTKQEIKKIMPRLTGWTYVGEKLTREFEFQDFSWRRSPHSVFAGVKETSGWLTRQATM